MQFRRPKKLDSFKRKRGSTGRTGSSGSTKDGTSRRNFFSGIRWRNPFLYIKVGLVLFAVLYTIFGDDGIYQSSALEGDVIVMEARIDSLTQYITLVRQRIDALQRGDLQILEEEARNLGMIKPGEKVYIIFPEDESDPLKRTVKK